ncbi:MAG TPA: DNA-directed RNA polymerase subunit alpha [Candidatus Hydrogenedentes bacterium]|nr:DNA-directed RNA polymerase subunit alpha [Candidatus Hydrogenedentota bacterium]HOJ68500.1 DNA-directed RNA polymerase subunit alpha [Candidatus Hydrogenedentota bacterium]HOK88810.1 DNA-directed RNA polymerase subunit alpha [Candidatus Hydrogenedentota bacterium]
MVNREFTIPQGYKVETGDDPNYARIVVEPFERGYGTTVGNALRRVLLASIPGSAVTAVRFEEASHEFMAIDGVKEDVSEIVLNIKACRVRLNEPNSIIFKFQKKGAGAVTAGDLFAGQPVDVFNPEQLIFTAVSDAASVTMEIKVDNGYGFVLSEQLEQPHAPLGTIYMDANFSPVTRVNFIIEDARVGQMTDYDRLILDIWTTGAITPEEALKKSAEILINHFRIFCDFKDLRVEEGTETSLPGEQINPEMLEPVSKLELSARASNCLRAAGVSMIGQLVQFTEGDLLKLPNFGKKSLEEIREKVAELGLSLGMTVRGVPPAIPGSLGGPVHGEDDDNEDDDDDLDKADQ